MVRRNFNSNLKGNIMIDLGKVSKITMGAQGVIPDASGVALQF
jgi:hypothetical protein